MLLTNESGKDSSFVIYYLDWILGRFNHNEELRVFYGPATDYQSQSNKSEFDLVILSDTSVNHDNVEGNISLDEEQIDLPGEVV